MTFIVICIHYYIIMIYSRLTQLKMSKFFRGRERREMGERGEREKRKRGESEREKGGDATDIIIICLFYQ